MCAAVECSAPYSKCVSQIDQTSACICPICNEMYTPVCGDNGMSYASLCRLKEASCKSKRKIDVIKYSHCGKSCSS